MLYKIIMRAAPRALALACLLALVTTGSVHADPMTKDPALTQVKGATGSDMKALSAYVFAQLKSLEGTWVGTFPEHKSSPAFVVTYRTIGGGSVVEETFRPGLAKETKTLYVKTADGLRADHVCHYGNQPSFQLYGSANDGSLFIFEEVGGHYPAPPGDKTRRMRLDTLEFADYNRVVTVWSTFEGDIILGAPTKIELTR